jgi:hypothetical protein
VWNAKIQQRKALKAIPLMGGTQSKLSQDFKIGIEVGSTCEYLVRYENAFVAGDFECIIMDYYEKGDVQTYLNMGNEIKEEVFFVLFLHLLL